MSWPMKWLAADLVPRVRHYRCEVVAQQNTGLIVTVLRGLLLVAVLVVAVACSSTSDQDNGAISAPPANGDSRNDYFVQQLDAHGVAVPDDVARADAIEAAKLGCSLESQGYTDGEAWGRLRTEFPDVDKNVIFTTMSVGILVYCPEYLG